LQADRNIFSVVRLEREKKGDIRNNRTIMELFDFDAISSLQTHLSNLTGLSLALYGRKGNIILPPVNENKLLVTIKSFSNNRDAYADFIKKSIDRSSHRNDVSIFKGPGDQYFFFLPLRMHDSLFVITGGGVYLSEEDFRNFYHREGHLYGLDPRQLEAWRPEITIRKLQDMQNTARHIRSLFSLVLETSHQYNVSKKRYKIMKIIMSLISDMKIDKPVDTIFDVVGDMILFLFNADSISILIKDKDFFRPLRTAGRLKNQLEELPIKMTGNLSEMLERQEPFFSESVMDILRMGLTDDIVSFHFFPIISDGKVTGILGLFNSPICEEDAEIIAEICRITGFILKIIELQEMHSKYIKDADMISTAAEHIIPVKDPEKLYEAILETSVQLAEAEKGSLMLTDGDNTSYLTIKAAKGINKRLQGEIRIRAGEGIAGKVFQEGLPVIVDDIGRNERAHGTRRPKYKTGSFISLPLKIGEKTIGVLNISDKVTGEIFSGEDLIMLRSFASYASIALERSTYYSLAGHLRELSITDVLTGLFNRRYFEERFYEELHRSERHNLSFSLAMIDIDDFKLFNDTEGHLAGDEILRSIAYIAKDTLRIIDVIARFGGEEFAVIMPQTEKGEAFLVTERIRTSIKEQITRTWGNFPREAVTISIGIATYPVDGQDRKELIRSADRALYRAKIEGKDRTILWESSPL
jgi:diguanylate cyclase (GGDEF)-like protein